MDTGIAAAIRETLTTPNEIDRNGEPANIAEAVFALAESIRSAGKWLGNGDAATPMGALEAHGKAVLDAADRIAGALSDVADAIRKHGPHR